MTIPSRLDRHVDGDDDLSFSSYTSVSSESSRSRRNHSDDDSRDTDDDSHRCDGDDDSLCIYEKARRGRGGGRVPNRAVARRRLSFQYDTNQLVNATDDNDVRTTDHHCGLASSAPQPSPSLGAVIATSNDDLSRTQRVANGMVLSSPLSLRKALCRSPDSNRPGQTGGTGGQNDQHNGGSPPTTNDASHRLRANRKLDLGKNGTGKDDNDDDHYTVWESLQRRDLPLHRRRGHRRRSNRLQFQLQTRGRGNNASRPEPAVATPDSESPNLLVQSAPATDTKMDTSDRNNNNHNNSKRLTRQLLKHAVGQIDWTTHHRFVHRLSPVGTTKVTFNGRHHRSLSVESASPTTVTTVALDSPLSLSSAPKDLAASMIRLRFRSTIAMSDHGAEVTLQDDRSDQEINDHDERTRGNDLFATPTTYVDAKAFNCPSGAHFVWDEQDREPHDHWVATRPEEPTFTTTTPQRFDSIFRRPRIPEHALLDEDPSPSLAPSDMMLASTDESHIFVLVEPPPVFKDNETGTTVASSAAVTDTPSSSLLTKPCCQRWQNLCLLSGSTPLPADPSTHAVSIDNNSKDQDQWTGQVSASEFENAISRFLSSPLCIHDWNQGWQVWSYFAMISPSLEHRSTTPFPTRGDHNNNEAAAFAAQVQADLHRVLQNRAFDITARRLRLQALRHNLHPFDHDHYHNHMVKNKRQTAANHLKSWMQPAPTSRIPQSDSKDTSRWIAKAHSFHDDARQYHATQQSTFKISRLNTLQQRGMDPVAITSSSSGATHTHALHGSSSRLCGNWECTSPFQCTSALPSIITEDDSIRRRSNHYPQQAGSRIVAWQPGGGYPSVLDDGVGGGYDSDPEDICRRRQSTLSSSTMNPSHFSSTSGRSKQNIFPDPCVVFDEEHSRIGKYEDVQLVVQEIINDRWTLILHQEMQHPYACSTPTTRFKTYQGISTAVRVWIERGTILSNRVIVPKLHWRNDNNNDDATYGPYSSSMDLLDIHRVLPVSHVDRQMFPFAKHNHCFLLKSLDKSLLLEARSETQRDWLVRSLKLVVSRLASTLVVRDPLLVDEFFQIDDPDEMGGYKQPMWLSATSTQRN